MEKHLLVSFNPCCVGSVASTAVPLARGLRPGPVSILVVLDRSRQPGLRRGAAGRGHCFNPCCVGSVASTGRPGVDRTGLYTVSILVVLDRSRQRKTISLFSINMPLFQSLLCWIGRVNLGYNPVPERHHIRFQSLLCWIGRVNWPLSKPSHFLRQCFNPCCVGSVASTINNANNAPNDAQFQSLLCWIGRVNQRRR